MTSSTHEGNGRRLATENGDEYEAFSRFGRLLHARLQKAGRRKEIKQQFNSKNRQAWGRELDEEISAWKTEQWEYSTGKRCGICGEADSPDCALGC